MRPTCEKILALPSVLPKMQSDKIKLEDDVEEQDVLLNTIKIPKNMAMLTDRLPKPTYNNVDFKSIGSRPIKGAIETKPRLLPDINKNSKNEILSEVSYNASTKNSRPQSKHDTDGHSNQPELLKPVRKHKVIDSDKHSDIRGGVHGNPVVDRHQQERAEHIELAKVQGRHLKHRPE